MSVLLRGEPPERTLLPCKPAQDRAARVSRRGGVWTVVQVSDPARARRLGFAGGDGEDCLTTLFANHFGCVQARQIPDGVIDGCWERKERGLYDHIIGYGGTAQSPFRRLLTEGRKRLLLTG